MPAVSREGDSLATGHICATTTVLAAPGQTTVKANSILIARKTDPTISHLFPNSAPPPLCISHTAVVNVGSSTVYVVGKGVARIGDSADRGSMTSGSSNVFAGP